MLKAPKKTFSRESQIPKAQCTGSSKDPRKKTLGEHAI